MCHYITFTLHFPFYHVQHVWVISVQMHHELKPNVNVVLKSLSSVKQVRKKSNRAVWDSRFSFPSVHFNHVFHISSIFSTRVTLSCEPQRDKCNYLTLCFTRPHINMPVLSAENRDNNRRKCERSSSHNCCFTVRLDRQSDNIQKKNTFFSPLFIYRYVILRITEQIAAHAHKPKHPFSFHSPSTMEYFKVWYAGFLSLLFLN